MTYWRQINEKDTFKDFPITFQTIFENNWNIHLKPYWKIILTDEKWEILKDDGNKYYLRRFDIFNNLNWEKLWKLFFDKYLK